MSDSEGSFDYCKHDWEPLYDDNGKKIGKSCKGLCSTTVGSSS